MGVLWLSTGCLGCLNGVLMVSGGCLVSVGRCLEGFWWVFKGCLKVPWRVSAGYLGGVGRCDWCQLGIKSVSG